jgi:hypothetical protein
LALFKTNGSVPVFTTRGSGSGGSTFVSSAPFTPAVGSSLMFVTDTAAQSVNPDVSHISDTAGNTWVKLFDPYATYFDTGVSLNYSAQITMWFCENPANVSTTITATLLPLASGGAGAVGTWQMYEISNLSNISSGSYTFQSSDNTKLVEFTGGANVAATLPSSVFAAGWQALVVNNGGGVVTITSAAPLNGSNNSVLLAGGTSTWIFSDGSAYWTAPVSTPQSIPKTVSRWVDGYSSYSGTFTQSQPDFSDLAGLTKAAKYNGNTLVANGFAAEYATVDRTAQTANIGAATQLYAVPSNGAGLYRVSVYIVVSQAATTSSTLPDSRIFWTDQNSSAAITTSMTASSNANTTSTFMQGTIIVNAKANTTINYDAGQVTPYASSGATPMQYAYHARVEYLG